MGRTALITGATGALGPAVLRAFHDADWDVRTLSRRPPAAGTAAAEFPHVAADTTDTLALADAMRGANVIVHIIDGKMLIDTADHAHKGPGRVGLYKDRGGADDRAIFDWLLVRKYSPTEPIAIVRPE